MRLPTTRDGVLLRTTFRVHDGRIDVVSLTGVPLFTENNFWDWWRERASGHDIRVVPLQDADDAVQSARLGPISEALGEAVLLIPAEVQMDTEQTGESASSALR